MARTNRHEEKQTPDRDALLTAWQAAKQAEAVALEKLTEARRAENNHGAGHNPDPESTVRRITAEIEHLTACQRTKEAERAYSGALDREELGEAYSRFHAVLAEGAAELARLEAERRAVVTRIQDAEESTRSEHARVAATRQSAGLPAVLRFPCFVESTILGAQEDRTPDGMLRSVAERLAGNLPALPAGPEQRIRLLENEKERLLVNLELAAQEREEAKVRAEEYKRRKDEEFRAQCERTRKEAEEQRARMAKEEGKRRELADAYLERMRQG